MLTPQRARENVLSALASASSCFGNWQTSLDAVRLFMYQKDEPLASTARYFERHSRKDWSPVRRFTGRCLAQCLRSRMVRSTLSSSLGRPVAANAYRLFHCLQTCRFWRPPPQHRW